MSTGISNCFNVLCANRAFIFGGRFRHKSCWLEGLPGILEVSVNHLKKTLALLSFIICCSCGGGGGGVGESPAVDPHTAPLNGPPAGNPAGHYPVPAEAVAEDVSWPDRLVGNGTPGSCTAAAFIQAVAQGGKIKFN